MAVFTDAVRGTVATVGSTMDVDFRSGFGNPAAVLFIVSGGTADGTEAGRPCMSIGAADGTRNRVYAFGTENAGSGRENGWSFASRDGIIAVPNQSGGSDGLYSWNSWRTNGVKLNVDTAASLAYKYTAWAINGDGVQAYVGDQGSVNPGLSANITAPGFAPDIVIFFGQKAFLGAGSGVPAWAAPGQLAVGFAARLPSTTQCGGGWLNVDNTLTTDLRAFTSDVYVLQTVVSGSATLNVRLSAWRSDGFTVANDDVSNASPGFAYVAIKVPGWGGYAKTISTPTSVTDQLYTTPGIEPQSCIVVSTAVTAVDATPASDATASSIGYGLAGGRTSTVDGCAAVRDEDAKTSPFNAGGVADSKVAHLRTSTGASALLVADAGGWNSEGFTLSYSSVGASACKWPSLALGSILRTPDESEPCRMELDPPEAIPY